MKSIELMTNLLWFWDNKSDVSLIETQLSVTSFVSKIQNKSIEGLNRSVILFYFTLF